MIRTRKYVARNSNSTRVIDSPPQKLQQFPGSGPDGAGLYVTPARLSNGRPDCDAARHTRRTRPAAAARAPTAAHDVCTPSVRWNLAVAANCGDSTQLTGETAGQGGAGARAPAATSAGRPSLRGAQR